MKTNLRSTLVAAMVLAAGAAHAQTDTSAESTRPGTMTMTTGTSMTTTGGMTNTGGMALMGAGSKATNKDLAGSLAGASDFSTLQTALVAAGLAEQAKGQGPFTVFAPTNAAFGKLPPGTVRTLTTPSNKKKLAGILAYHVVAGNVMAADLKDGQQLTTVAGGTLTVRKRGNIVMLTDAKGGSASVTIADIQATNGTVHAIDTVLMPK